MSNAKLAAVLDTLQAAADRKKFRRMDFFSPYPKQLAFFAMGVEKRERMLMAGNQLGKTEGGAYEAALHMTGQYPEWWPGRRFDYPNRGWIDGETSTLVRDVQQKKLCGTPGVLDALGTGFIPKDAIVDTSLARGVTDAFDTIQVRHVSGGISTATFKSYEQGRQKHQGEPVDWIWLDEEPPMDIYSECLTRTTATKGMVFMTFTPLKGRSDVVIRYLDEPSPDRGYIGMVIEDAGHISPEERERIIAGYPAHERDARARGIPMLGSGRIFPYPETMLAEPFIDMVPLHWVKLWGTDFGIDHPFAAVLIAWDRDNDVVHVLNAIKMADGLPINHAAAMRPVAVNVPVAWPQDGTQRDKGSGVVLSRSYKEQGLQMLPDHATWPDGGNSTEAGIAEMSDRITTNRLKVAAHLSEWFEEYRFYHRKDGLIVKIKDDIMSATRVALMMKRYAKPVALGGRRAARVGSGTADGLDFDLF